MDILSLVAVRRPCTWRGDLISSLSEIFSAFERVMLIEPFTGVGRLLA